MCRVADAQKPRSRPRNQSIDGNCEHAHLFPVLQFSYAISQEWFERCDFLAECRKPTPFHVVRCTFWDNKCALPVIFAIKHYHHLALFDVAERLARIVLATAQAHPHHVHRRAEINHFEPRTLSNSGMAAIRTDREVSSDLQKSVSCACAYTSDASGVVYKSGGFRLRPQLKTLIFPSLLRNEIQEVHWGISAMNLQCVGRCVKSAMATVSRPIWPDS